MCNTPFVIFRFTIMPFGLTTTGDAFQGHLNTIFNYLAFYTGIADDMTIWVVRQMVMIMTNILQNFAEHRTSQFDNTLGQGRPSPSLIP